MSRILIPTLVGSITIGVSFLYFHWYRKSKVVKEQEIIEICVSDIQSAINAFEAGANSIELCSNRKEGGVTASFGFVQECLSLLRNFKIKIHVLIRPRPGDFVYSSLELNAIWKDIEAMVRCGVDGIVFGALTKEGKVDTKVMKKARLLSKGVELTFHRAFDMCKDPFQSLEDIIELDCDRLLTSGTAVSAPLGVTDLGLLVKRANQRLPIIAASGINEWNVESIIDETDVQGVHTGSSVTVPVHNLVVLGEGIIRQAPARIADFEEWDCVDIKKTKDFVRRAQVAWRGKKLKSSAEWNETAKMSNLNAS